MGSDVGPAQQSSMATTASQQASATKRSSDSQNHAPESAAKQSEKVMTNEDTRSMTPDSSPTKSLSQTTSPSKSKNRKRRKAAATAANKQQSETPTTTTKPQSKLPVRQTSKSNLAATSSPASQVTSSGHSAALGTKEQQKGKKDVSEPTLESQQRERALKEQVKTQAQQINELVEKIKLQLSKTRELEVALNKSNSMYRQLEKLLESELSAKNSLENEKHELVKTALTLKMKISRLEENKFTNEELIRVLNATLMERETEISILKLKLTRFQTNLPAAVNNYPSSSTSNVSSNIQTTRLPAFERNSQLRATRIADAASANRIPVSQLRSDDRDSSIWAKVPEELTPSKRPLALERNMNLLNEELNSLYGTTTNTNHFERDRRYKTLPRSMKSPSQEFNQPIKQQQQQIHVELNNHEQQSEKCQVTNLDDSNSTSHGSQGNRTLNNSSEQQPNNNELQQHPSDNFNRLEPTTINYSVPGTSHPQGESLYSNLVSTPSRQPYNPPPPLPATANNNSVIDHKLNHPIPPRMPPRTSTAPVKFSSKVKKFFHIFKSSPNSTNAHSASKTDLTNCISTPVSSPFHRGPSRSTMLPTPCDIRAQMTPSRQVMSFQTDKPFAEWDTDMLVDWLTMIGLSMYAAQCKRWVKTGADILDATPAEVDKGLGITNHLHRKKLRLAISELNGDCDKITKAAAKLDYLWVARWLDDIGLPQYKESFINARVDGRVLNYLTVEDLISLDVKSVLHHISIKCGIRVLRSIQFDLQLLKRRATAEEIEQMMNSVKQNLLPTDQTPSSDNHQSSSSNVANSSQTGSDDAVVALWTCHRVMEWLRLIDFAEFSPNLRGSGVHGGLIVFEDGFNAETMCALLCIPSSKTLLRRHLFNYFKILLGPEVAEKKRLYSANSSNQPLNPSAEIKTARKSQPWFSKIKSSLVAQETIDDYLCPMYPVNQQPLIIPGQQKSNTNNTKSEFKTQKEVHHLGTVPESVNV